MKLNGAKRGIVTGIVFFLSLYVSSQSIVHIENSRFSQRNEGFSGNLDVGLNFTQAVNFIFNTSNASQLQYAKKNHSVLSVNSLNLTVVNKTTPVNDGFQHFRYGYKIKEHYIFESFVQGQYNHNTRLKARYLAGIGMLFKVFETKKDSLQLYTGVHYMPEYEEEMGGKINRHHRLNSIVSFNVPFSSKSAFELVAYIQPDIARLTDFRISSQASYEIPITEKLLFKVAFAVFYDTHPPEGLQTTFFSARNSLKYKFGKK